MKYPQIGILVFAAIALNVYGQDVVNPEREIARLYEPYLNCVIDNAKNFSTGPDSASDIAIAAMGVCQQLEKTASSEAILINKSHPSALSLNEFRSLVQDSAKKAAITIAVKTRAK